MDFFGLTTVAQIRAVLTVDEMDLDDDTIESYGLDDDLGAYLDAVEGWEVIAATPSKNQRSLRIIAKNFCAGTLAKRAQVFVLKKFTDGSNEGGRSDKDGWAWMAEGLLKDAQTALDDLLEDLGQLPEPVEPSSVIMISIPTRDPIKTPRTAR